VIDTVHPDAWLRRKGRDRLGCASASSNRLGSEGGNRLVSAVLTRRDSGLEVDSARVGSVSIVVTLKTYDGLWVIGWLQGRVTGQHCWPA
jgi:hypothetical protein